MLIQESNSRCQVLQLLIATTISRFLNDSKTCIVRFTS